MAVSIGDCVVGKSAEAVNGRHVRRLGPAISFQGLGLYRLRGKVKYPTQATSRRSSLSRVRENRTHGLTRGR